MYLKQVNTAESGIEDQHDMDLVVVETSIELINKEHPSMIVYVGYKRTRAINFRHSDS